MNAAAELGFALAEWRQMTDFESEAILSDNWQEVAEQQSRKAQLQIELGRLLALACTTPFSQAHTSRAMEGKFDSAVSELMVLERRNGDLLATKRRCREAELERLAMTLRDLQGVRRAYGSVRGPHWQSYS
jgi:hypothetical protein